MATKLGLDDFKASDGWLSKFKLRHKIKGEILHGESGSVDVQIVDRWKQIHTDLINSYDAKNIFNVDETGLMWRCTPNKTLIFENEMPKGLKKSKERLTIMLCCSSSGEKLKPVVIGKSKNLRSFRNKFLPVEYDGNKSSWMTSSLFSTWLLKLDEKMKEDKRKILLLLDNAPVHPIDIQLTNLRLLFFPKNSTSVIQPLDQGIIRSFKCHYRFKLMTYLLSFKELDEMNSQNKKFDLYDAIQWISQSWNAITTETISNCFKHANFSEKITIELNSQSSREEMYLNKLATESKITGEEFISFDNNLETSEEIVDVDENEIMKAVIDELEQDIESENEEADEIEESAPISKVKTLDEAISSFNDIFEFLKKFDLQESSLDALMKVRNDLCALKAYASLSQTSLLDYFQEKK